MIRKAAVMGQFYTNRCEVLQQQIEEFNTIVDEHLEDKRVLTSKARMIIAPHAGYIYSGFTANIAHRVLANTQAQRVIVIGPSHRVYIEGASISLHDSFETPCGCCEMDRDYALKLQKEFGLLFLEDAHFEHSTETQIPMIHHYLPQAKVCEIVYGDIDFHRISALIDEVLTDPHNVVVISTDLSHFYSLKEANTLDNSCLKAMQHLDTDALLAGPCEACGKIGVLAALTVAQKRSMQLRLLDYRTSADRTKDESSVVGYVSAVIS